MKEKPYLADVQPGDKLYNFLERNKEYTVNEVKGEEGLDYPIIITGDDRVVRITLWGTEILREKVPYFLYASVEVLDPKNLPPRPWRPRKGEWVWAKRPKTGWVLAKFVSRNPHNEDYSYWCILQEKPGKLAFSEIAPFKGELPPGLEGEDGE